MKVFALIVIVAAALIGCQLAPYIAPDGSVWDSHAEYDGAVAASLTLDFCTVDSPRWPECLCESQPHYRFCWE